MRKNIHILYLAFCSIMIIYLLFIRKPIETDRIIGYSLFLLLGILGYNKITKK